MKSEAFWLGAMLLMAAIVAALLTTEYVTISAVVFVLIGVLIVVRISPRMAIDSDRRWLATLLSVAFITKIGGTVARFGMVTLLYDTGDSFRYYQSAIELVHTWRRLEVPQGLGGGAGTRFTEVFTSLLFLPGIPSFFVGFMMFAALSFIGQVFFYLAFRRWIRDESRLLMYAVLVFFMPTLVFWPSSIGKDAVIVFALGIAAYGGSRLLGGKTISGLAILAPSVLLAVAVRAHVAAIFAVALILALGLAKGVEGVGWVLRLAVLALGVAGVIFVGTTAATNLNVDLSAEGVGTALEETQSRTEQGGSAVVGAPVTSPLDFPEAMIRVLYRPLPNEASTLPMAASSVEGMLLLLITLWRFPTMFRNLRTIRSQPYLMLGLLYVFGFIVAFSSILNLGIMTRQRAQVLPFLLVVLVGLGWSSKEVEPEPEAEPMPVAAAR